MSDFKVLLLGGPSFFPDEQRVQLVSALEEKIKHRFGAHYEHFVRQGRFERIDGEELAVYQWTARTAIAE